MSSSPPELYRLVQEEQWDKAAQRAATMPEEAKYFDPSTKRSALHCVVRRGNGNAARFGALQALLEAYPGAATFRDEESGYTPLHYACLTTQDTSRVIEEHMKIIQLILQYSPKSLTITTRDGLTPLEIHVMALSRVKRDSAQTPSQPPRRQSNKSKSSSYMMILKTLVEAETQSSSSLAKGLDMFFSCNSLQVLEQVALEEAQATTSKLRARRQARSSEAGGGSRRSRHRAPPPSGSTTIANFWIWECVMTMLYAEHYRKSKQQDSTKTSKQPRPFHVLHAAAQVKDCPLVFLMLAMRAHPGQVRTTDDETGNLPLHMVAGWDVSDPACVSRKSMALSALVSEYPPASKVRNKWGKTPLSLALETGTTWDNGVRRITAFQRDGSFSNHQ